jgi:DNA-binding HxlR family transcriptional regulator
MAIEPTTTCPVGRALDLVGDRWSLLIVREAFDGARRFSDFQRRLGMSRSMLSQRLQALLEADVLTQQPLGEGGGYQEYVLTERGRALFPLVVALRQWGEAFLFAPGEPRSVLQATSDGLPLALMQPRDQRGQVVDAAATAVIKPVSA